MVMCSECGFLALRRYADSALVEADADYRRSGTVRKPLGGQFEITERLPPCFTQRRNFAELYAREGGEAARDSVEKADILSLINDEHPCDTTPDSDGFCEWQQGFAPKEHREMLDRHRLLEMEANRETDRRIFEAGLAAKASLPQWWGVAVALGGLAVAAIALLR